VIEVEVKASIRDIHSVLGKIHALGAEYIGEEYHEDVYFKSPNGDLARRDEALRIRKTQNGTYITYKGPKIDPETKTREEIEIRIDDPEKAIDIFKRLGFDVLAVVRKRRRIYRYDEFTICIDEVEGLGHFIEVEKLVNGEGIEGGKRKIFALLAMLGISRNETIRKSYLEMLYSRMGLISVKRND